MEIRMFNGNRIFHLQCHQTTFIPLIKSPFIPKFKMAESVAIVFLLAELVDSDDEKCAISKDLI